MRKPPNQFERAMREVGLPTTADEKAAAKQESKRQEAARREREEATRREREEATRREHRLETSPAGILTSSATESHRRLWQFLTSRLNGAEMGRWERMIVDARPPDAGTVQLGGWLLVASLPSEDAAGYSRSFNAALATVNRLCVRSRYHIPTWHRPQRPATHPGVDGAASAYPARRRHRRPFMVAHRAPSSGLAGHLRTPSERRGL
jgi:hypothetical protein